MTLVEEYYELNEADQVPIMWKIVQIAFYVVAAFFGLWSGYTMALLRLKFGDKCYLFTTVKFSRFEQTDGSNANWGNNSWCDFGQYSMVSSFIVAMIWATFFLMCGKGGKSTTGLPQPWRIVWPSLTFNFIYFVIALIAATNIQQGTDHFCSRRYFDKKTQIKLTADGCPTLKALLKKDLRSTTLFQLEIVMKASWGCVSCWFILFLLSFFRIIFVIDFNMYKICVFKIDETDPNKQEEVLGITNYEELKKLPLREEQHKRVAYEFEKKLYDLEGNRGNGKLDKKSMRQYHHRSINVGNHLPLQGNDVFFLTADIRMLNRDKKSKKFSKSLNQIFEKGSIPLEFGMRKSLKTKSKLDDPGTLGTPTLLDECVVLDSKDLNDEDIEESSFFSNNTADDFYEHWLETNSGRDIFVTGFEKKHSMQFKKFI